MHEAEVTVRRSTAGEAVGPADERSGACEQEAFFFEHDGFRLFAICHRPAGPSAELGFVFCHPYGEEKQASYPVLARFARELAADGFPVLRFDARGYGDSDGDLEDATVGSQLGDTLAAARQLRRRLGVSEVGLLGLRLGATVAALAAERASELGALILWSPVTDGSRYLDELLRKKMFAEMLGPGQGRSKAELLAELEARGRLDVEGQPLTREVYGEISAIDLPARVARFRGPVFVGALEHRRQDYTPFDRLVGAYRAAGASCVLEVASAQSFWDKSSMYRLYLPAELFAQTRRWIGSRWRES